MMPSQAKRAKEREEAGGFRLSFLPRLYVEDATRWAPSRSF